MSRRNVPDLARKIDLLIASEPIGSREAFAQCMGVSAGTTYDWANGTATSPANTLPQTRIAAFAESVAAALGCEENDPIIGEIVHGPADLLATRLQARNAPALTDTVQKIGREIEAKLIRPESEIGAVRIVRQSDIEPKLRLRLGEAFRLEFHDGPGFRLWIALQKSPSGWWSLGRVAQSADGVIHFPGESTQGTFDTMVEDSEAGRHRFVVVGLRQSLAISFDRFESEQMPIDALTLSAFSKSLLELKSDRRFVGYCDLAIRKPLR